VISGLLVQWLACRWAWLRPRTVPIIAALLGLLVVMGATKYLPVYSSSEPRAAPRLLRAGKHVQPAGGTPGVVHGDHEACVGTSDTAAPHRWRADTQ
jgi:hypothetical protein